MSKEKIQVVLKVAAVLMWFKFSQVIASQLGLYSLQFFLKIPYQISLEQHMYLLNAMAQLFCIAGLVIMDGRRLDLKELIRWFTVKKVIIYMTLGVVTYLGVAFIGSLFVTYFPEYQAIVTLFGTHEKVLRFLVLVLGAPLLEEYVFRGKIQNIMKEKFETSFAIFVQAVLFGMLHALWFQKLYTSVMGMILGAVKEKEGHLQSTVMMHMTINLIGWIMGQGVFQWT